jgi:hypothetical protein
MTRLFALFLILISICAAVFLYANKKRFLSSEIETNIVVTRESLDISKVTDNGRKTYIHTKSEDFNVMTVVDKKKNTEPVNYTYTDGIYTVDRVLLSGEQIVLIVGNEKVTITRR